MGDVAADSSPVVSQLTREARPQRAPGLMGRRKEGRRLADPVFKMADKIMADSGEILNLENRPFHRSTHRLTEASCSFYCYLNSHFSRYILDILNNF